jgi:hypothetical protein
MCGLLLSLLLLLTNFQDVRSMIPIRARSPTFKLQCYRAYAVQTCRHWCVGNDVTVRSFRTMAASVNSDNGDASSDRSTMQQSDSSYNNDDGSSPRRSRLADRIRQLDMAKQIESVEYRTTYSDTTVDSSSNDDDVNFQVKQGIFQIKSAEQHTYVRYFL